MASSTSRLKKCISPPELSRAPSLLTTPVFERVPRAMFREDPFDSRRHHRLWTLLPAFQDAPTGQQCVQLVARQCVHVVERGFELRVSAQLLDRTRHDPQFLAMQGQVIRQPFQIDRELKAARRAGDGQDRATWNVLDDDAGSNTTCCCVATRRSSRA